MTVLQRFARWLYRKTFSDAIGALPVTRSIFGDSVHAGPFMVIRKPKGERGKDWETDADEIVFDGYGFLILYYKRGG